jgi:hypothetical protein
MPPPGTGGALGTAIYTSRSAVTAFWHSKPTFKTVHSDGQRMAIGRVIAAQVRVGRSLELRQYAPDIETTVRSEGYDSATIRAADLWPSTYIGDETAVYDSDRIVPLCVLSVEVYFDCVEGILQKLPAGLETEYGPSEESQRAAARLREPGAPEKIAALREAFCNPDLQDVHFEGDNWSAAVLFELLKARQAPMHMVSLSGCCGFVDAELFLPIAEALRSNCGLKKLRFTFAKDDANQLIEEISAHLCRALVENTNLTHLTIGFANGWNGHCSPLSWIELLSKNRTLQELRFCQHSELHKDGIKPHPAFESGPWSQFSRDRRVHVGDGGDGGVDRSTSGSIKLHCNFMTRWPHDHPQFAAIKNVFG